MDRDSVQGPGPRHVRRSRDRLGIYSNPNQDLCSSIKARILRSFAFRHSVAGVVVCCCVVAGAVLLLVTFFPSPAPGVLLSLDKIKGILPSIHYPSMPRVWCQQAHFLSYFSQCTH